MQQFEMDPDAELSLAVIDATLAGEAVEPEHAELAELTLILAGQRPLPSASFAADLDERVARRFAPRPSSSSSGRKRRWWLYAPGAAFAAAASIALVVILSSSGSRQQDATLGLPQTSAAAPATSAASSSASATVPQASAPGASAGRSLALPAIRRPSAARDRHSLNPGANFGPASSTAAAASSAGSLGPAPAPTGAGRQIIQSAQLALSTRPKNVDTVSQEVFNVVSTQNGVVNSSNITATNNANGYAQFELSVPSTNLEQTMSALSRLRGASVISRTDATQDVTAQAGGAGRRLSEARALRTSLLKQLAAATTTTAIDSLKIQLRDVDAAISRDLASLNRIHNQVNMSKISVTINAAPIPVHPVAKGGGFTLGRAAHDAGRVLVFTAGAALIALAVLVPLGLLGALVAWAGFAIRRRRREQALDLV
jgi:hypothetical protein